ncbi:WD repeat-containing protein 45 [Microdochium nivale]|nr:WD repeat-containing protein 45 [Microdochium nivale]
MGGSKKKEKQVKENGGVVAAMTRHGVKFSSTTPVTSDVGTPSETPPTPSPELGPTEPPLISTQTSSIASPVLGATATIPTPASTVPSAISEWPKNMSHLGGSPNLISLMSESPPTQPSSYEDSRGMSYGWTPQQRARAQQYATSVSPPESIRRPLSFQADGHFPGHDIRSQASSPPSIRRASMHSPFSGGRLGHNPPLPHQPQAHFYGAPELDLVSGQNRGIKAGDRGYHLGLDVLPNWTSSRMASSNNVVLAGYEGGLDVYNVSKRGVDPVATLHGLRGAVHHAKILNWTTGFDSSGAFPLVAVVIHGPVIPVMAQDSTPENQGDEIASSNSEDLRTPQSDSNQKLNTASKSAPTIDAYQTSVEVYSLKTSKLVGVLLELPKIPIKSSLSNPVFRSPSPSGAIQIRADEGHIVVSSGETGECWIYRQVEIEEAPGFEFRCLGKVWTSLQQGLKSEPTAEEERSHSPLPTRKLPPAAVLAVNGRWLAYCPPAPSSQSTLNALVPVPIEGKAPGIATLASPVLPNESSDVDQPISDGVMNRIMRETTQEFIQGARWVGKHGMQLWNNYWKPGQQSPSRPATVGSPPWSNSYGSRADASLFPPTYGISGQAHTKDPGLVSVVDLKSIANSATLHHVTTFKAPLGCSFMSFAPSGLFLFTASSKGDVQTVWDFMRIQHTKSSALQNSPPQSGHATRVRQVAQFSRMTVARIVDVAWSRPNGDRIAMVTDKGTVHLLDMPDSAYAWPPPRRRVTGQKTDPNTGDSAPSAVSMASTALSSAYGAAKPLISGQRRSSTQVQSNATIMEHASYSGKVLAAGISHSLGNAGTAINQLRHTGENRVALPLENMLPGLACAAWLSGRKDPHLFVVGDGLVRMFTGRSRKTPAAGNRPQQGRRYKDFKLRNVPDDVLAPSVKKTIEPEANQEVAPAEEHEGGHTLVLPQRNQLSASVLGPESSIPQAEIESSAPYQPFHTDRRVGLFEYDGEAHKTATKKSQPGGSTAWAFGQPISGVKVSIRLPIPVDDESVSGSIEDHRALPAYAMERVMQVGENEEQIVVTTRRRRHGNRASADVEDEDEFFEDELEVIDFADQRV